MFSYIRPAVHPCLRFLAFLRRRLAITFIGTIAIFSWGLYWHGTPTYDTSTGSEPILPFSLGKSKTVGETKGRKTVELARHSENTKHAVLACKLPILDPFHESVTPYIKDLEPLHCGQTYSRFENNNLTVQGENIVAVKYRIINRPYNNDFSATITDSVDVPNMVRNGISKQMVKNIAPAHVFKGVARIQADFIRVDITHGATQSETTEVHMNTALKREVLQRTVTPAGIPVSIAMIMFDSTSAANFQRKMPKSLKYLKELPTVFMKGETIVGDGTTAQLCAMLTGIAEKDQPEARRQMPNSKSVDDWRWVFRNYANRGYVTMYSEDAPGVATFNYRLNGFTNPPTDHYGRNFWLEAERYSTKDYCTGNLPTHQLTMTYFLSLFRTYLNNPKFAFLLFSDLCHGNLNSISYGDEDLYNLLKTMERDSFLDNTIVFIFGDHGSRYGPLRKTLQGKLEERLPHMSITFPKWFPNKHPNLFENIQNNSELLTTPFDIYATLQHILSYPLPPKGIKTGQSLLTPINPQERTCSTSGVDDHWCPCLSLEEVSVADPVVKEITAFSLQHINHLLDLSSEVKRLCHTLTLKEIRIALRQMPNEKLQKFEGTYKDDVCDSCGVKFGEKTANKMSKDTLYQIQFVTSPNNGFFEASIIIKSGAPSIKGEISRVDTFGHQSDCIKDTYVHLIKYCYCKKR